MARFEVSLRSWSLRTCFLMVAVAVSSAAWAGAGPKSGAADPPGKSSKASKVVTPAKAPPVEASKADPPSKAPAEGAPSASSCVPDGTPKDDDIVCTDTDEDGVDGGKGDDTITITIGSRVITFAFDPLPHIISVEGGEGDDTITNDGEISASSESLGNVLKKPPANGNDKKDDPENDLEEKKGAQATGIHGGDGNDTILNTGSVSADATTTALDIAAGSTGLKVDVGAASAIAGATGIDGGSGNDTLTNSGDVSATATAIALKAEFTANLGLSTSDDAATAKATAVGMEGGEGDDSLSNTGNVSAVATAIVGAGSGSGSGGPNALVPRFGAASEHTAEAKSTGLSGGDGDDTLNNEGDASATSTAVAASLTVDLRANGAAKAISTSKADSDATAIDAGDGDDTVTNDGTLSAVATSVSAAQSTAVSKSGKAPVTRAAWGGGAEAEAKATGIDAGAGADDITNNQEVSAVATAVTATSALGISVEGVASADSTSTAKSTATAIDAGGGDDNIDNTGDLTAVSTATSGALDLTFSKKGKSKAEQKSGATAEAEAVGISADGTESDSNTDKTLDLIPFKIDAQIRHEETAATGADTITNDGSITAVATAVSGSVSAAISVEGASSSDSKSKAESTATGIDAGGGDDDVTNNGDIDATSTAVAGTIGFSFSKGEDADAKAGAEAEAEAFGIRGDGTEASSAIEATLTIDRTGLDTTFSYEKTAATGDDTITNTNSIGAVSTAVSGAGSVGVSMEENVSAEAKSTAKSNAVGIEAGAGDDTVTNSGEVEAVSTAVAGALGFSFSEGDDAVAKSNATAAAEATGINGDGAEGDFATETTLHIGLDGLDAEFRLQKTASSGDDTITNSESVSAVATAVSGAGSLPISMEETVSADATSKAEARAVGIEAGAGDDTVDNSGDVEAVSTAVAGALGVSFSKGDDAKAKASATAESEAIGIRGDGTDADFRTQATLHIGADGLDTSFALEKTASTGDDTITNTDTVIAVSTAVSGAGSVAISIKENVSADAKSTAKSTAVGIEAGAGDDTVNNSGDVEAISTAVAGALGVSISKKDDAEAKASATAEAEAFGIRGDGTDGSFATAFDLQIGSGGLDTEFLLEITESTGDDTITNSNSISAVSTAVSGAGSAAVSIKDDVSAEAKSKAKATAVGIEAGGGDDTVDNSGEIEAISTAVSGALSLTFSKSDDAKAEASSTAEADAIGISGDGIKGDILTEARLHIGTDGLQTEFLFEKTGSTGDDTITNSDSISAVSTAVSGAGSVAVSIKDDVSADATSTAKATAAGVEAGAGDDEVTNTAEGEIEAVATAVAGALGLSFSQKDDANAKAGAKAEAEAVGIRGDGAQGDIVVDVALDISSDGLQGLADVAVTSSTGDDIITNDGSVKAVATAVSGAGSIAVAIDDSASADMSSTAKSVATAIEAGSGQDIVNNTGELDAVSVAVAGAFSAAIAGDDDAVGFKSIWSGGTNAEALAQGITGDGTGKDFSTSNAIDIDFTSLDVSLMNETSFVQAGDNDTITNDGSVTATAVAVSPDIDVAIAVDGKAAAASNAKADARAVAINAGTGDDTVTNTGDLTATSLATALAANVAVSKGAAIAANTIWDGGTEGTSEAVGISGDGEGHDWNGAGSIKVTDEAVTLDALLARTVVSGNDTITNDGSITATSIAAVPALGVAVSVDGAAASVSSAAATSRSAGIDAGAGDDTVTNYGDLTSTSVAGAVAVNVSVGKTGAAAGRMLWMGGTTADSEAIGISGDGDGKDFSLEGNITVDYGDFVELSSGLSLNSASGTDTIFNTGDIDATSVAVAASLDVAVATKSGVAAAASKATATSRAVSIDAGAAPDTITNSGDLIATSVANADAIAVSFTSKGVAVAGDALFDGGAQASSEAVGISGDGESSTFRAESLISVEDGDVFLGAGFSTDPEFTGAAPGDDDIVNFGDITSTSVAVAPSLGVAVALKGVAVASATSTAMSRAAGIDAGTGTDIVENYGDLTATSVAGAAAFSIAVTTAGVGLAADSFLGGGTTAEAESVGISGDGNGKDTTALATIEVTDGDVYLDAEFSSTAVSGDDELTNTGDITSTSVAVAASVDISVALKGVAGAAANATANARATGIDGGAGNDDIFNSGELTTTSVANADALAVAFTTAGVAVSSAFQGDIVSDAEAIGISGDGRGSDLTLDSSIAVVDKDVTLSASASQTAARGDDDITNTGAITATAVAATPSIDVSIALNGVAGSSTAATAVSRSAGIDAGAADDKVFNEGDVTSTSVATAIGVSVTGVGIGVAASIDPVFGGGTTAEAEAVGISGDGDAKDTTLTAGLEVVDDDVRLSAGYSADAVSGEDELTNEGDLTTTAVAVAASVDVAVAVEGGVAAAATQATANSWAVGIDGGAGGDTIFNSGELTTTSVANANAIAVTFTTAGLAASAAFQGDVSADAEAIGISGDGRGTDLTLDSSIEVVDGDVTMHAGASQTAARGDDDITNDGMITTTSVAITPSLNVAVAVGGVAGATTAATATARAAGIDAGGGDDIVFNQGEMTSTSVAGAIGISVSGVGAGVAASIDPIFQGGTTAEAEAVGISGDGDGTDHSLFADLEVIDDLVRLSAGYSADAVSGKDELTNEGDLTTTAVSVAASAGVAIVVEGGLAAAATTSKANALAMGMDGGGGGDWISNSGELTTTSVANANALTVSYATAGVAASLNFDGGAAANAEAIGISGDGKGENSSIGGLIEVFDGDVLVWAGTTSGVATGDDEIINTGKITSTSVAVAPSLDVAVALAGVAVSSSSASGTARAAAIDAGDGHDDIFNSGELIATSVANADAISVSVTPAGVAGAVIGVWDGGATAQADAVGISGDGIGTNGSNEAAVEVADGIVSLTAISETALPSGNDRIFNDGEVTATSVAVAPSIAVSVAVAGVSGAISSATAGADAVAIDGGSGDDEIENSETLTATSVAVAGGLAVAVTPAGVAISADAVWDGGTTATSEAVGISGDGPGGNELTESAIIVDGVDVFVGTQTETTASFGNDTIFNTGDVTATAVSVAPSISVAVAVGGVSAASSTATGLARAAAIDAGAGDDQIENWGMLEATSFANADAITVSVTPFGVAGAIGPVWDGGATAVAESIGISGDGSGRNGLSGSALELFDRDFALGTWNDTWGASGNDIIHNYGYVSSDAVAIAPSLSVGFTVFGVSAATSTATAEAYATAIDAGPGDDLVDNSGELDVLSVGTAVGASLAINIGGVAGALDMVWDGGTHANAEAVGISGDGRGLDDTSLTGILVESGTTLLGHWSTDSVATGNDWIRNYAPITTEAVAVAPSVALGLAVFGVSGAVSTSTSTSWSAGIDAGAGDDYVENYGDFDVTAFANSDAISGTFSLIGVSAAGTSAWDGGTTAQAGAAGISGDGLGVNVETDYTIEATSGTVNILEETTHEAVGGDDFIDNSGEINVSAHAVSVSADISLAGIGLAGAVSVSTAESDARAIDGGIGNDVIYNNGLLIADSDADAVAVAVGLSAAGFTAASGALWDSGTTADALSVGISGDGDGENSTRVRGIIIENSEFDTVDDKESETVGGADQITNTGMLKITAEATSTSVGASAAALGVASATMTGTARSHAAGIEAGAGDDFIDNLGPIWMTSTAKANTVAASGTVVGVVFASDTFWDAGTTSEAFAWGIDGGSGNDLISNWNWINILSDADTTSTTVAASGIGAAGAIALATANAEAAAIGGGDGNDNIFNGGKLVTRSEANAVGTGVGVTIVGFSGTDASANANATAHGIDGGAGNDEVENSNSIWSTATAVGTATEVTVSLVGAAVGVSAIDAETLADADAFGIDGGAGNDTLTNHSAIFSKADADTTATTVGVTIGGAAGGSNTAAVADSGATVIAGGDGNDTIDNYAGIKAISEATAVGTDVEVTVLGFAGTNTSATAIATATGIDGGVGTDDVTSSNNIWSTATGTSTATEVAVTIAGDAEGQEPHDGDTSAEARAIGISGGDGVDTLKNNAGIFVTSKAKSTANGVTVTVAGASKADVSTNSSAYGTGMSGGLGDDELVNNSFIWADVKGEAPATAVTVQAAGSTRADLSTRAFADAIGMSGGEGDDELINAGIIKLKSRSETPATSVSVGLIGAANAEAGASATSEATGMSGDGGDDTIINVGLIDIATYDDETDPVTDHSSKADAPVSGTTINLAGAAGQVTASASNAYVTGVGAGDGMDFVGNAGTIKVRSEANADVDGASFTLAGASSAQGTVTAMADATGIAGGSGQDLLYNEGELDVDVDSDLSSSGKVTAVFGVSGSDATVNGTLRATGIGGDEDDDEIVNVGTVEVDAQLSASMSGDGWTLTGEASATVGMTSNTFIDGLSGGAGNDLIFNSGDVIVSSTSTSNLNQSSWVLAGVAGDTGTFSAFGSATGIAGDSGSDELLNTGLVDIDVVTNLTATGGSDAIFGKAASGAELTSGSVATGMDGGFDDDLIMNLGLVNVYAEASMTSHSTSFAFIGASSAQAQLTADATAWGLLGGSGADEILNHLWTTVIASASLTAPVESEATIGDVNSELDVTATALAGGIEGGSGPDEILNNGFLTVLANATVTGDGEASASIGRAGSEIVTRGNASARGIGGGSGDDLILNRGFVTLGTTASPSSINDVGSTGFVSGNTAISISEATTDVVMVALEQGTNTMVNQGWLSGAAAGTANSDSVTAGQRLINLHVPAIAQATARNNYAKATGVSGGNGANVVVNEETLIVGAAPDATATADADGKGVLDGYATATATGQAFGAEARGVWLGSGNNSVRNSETSTMTVTASPSADAFATSDADGVKLGSPDATSTANVTASNALAVGIDVGHGDNQILNDGTLNVAASPQANMAEADALSGGLEWAIDAFAYATARADNAQAYGIRTGNGDNTIWNTDKIFVYSSPKANADAFAWGVGYPGAFARYATARATASATNAWAVGIQTGSGDDRIYNEGEIEVQSNPTASATATAQVTAFPWGNICSWARVHCGDPSVISIAGRKAIGISSGAGDDIVWNAGNITAMIGSFGIGTGVDLGPGDDELVLLDGSDIVGYVKGGAGLDTLAVDGAAEVTLNTLFAPLITDTVSGFETMTLVGASSLTIGTSHYMQAGHDFNVQVNGDGSHGQLRIGWTGRLAGNLTVAKGPGLFIDGTTYDVVDTDLLLLGTFSSTTLPTPNPLVSFTTNQLVDRYQVISNVASFTAIAGNKSSNQSFASQLDGILPYAQGDLEAMLVQMQQMPSGADFESAFSKLNPANVVTLTENSLDTIETYMSGVGARLASLRGTGGASTSYGDSKLSSFEESDAVEVGPSRRKRTSWAAHFTKTGNLGGFYGNHGMVGTTEGFMSGVDFGIGDRTVAGFAFGSTMAVSAIDFAAGNGNAIEGNFMSIYGTHRINGGGYVDAQVSYSQHTNKGLNLLARGGQPGHVNWHSSAMIAGRVETGHVFPTGGSRPELFASLAYKSLREDAFDGAGESGLGLLFDRRTSRVLETELGIRINQSFDTAIGQVQPQLSVAWVHDFYAGENEMTARFADVPDYRFVIPVRERVKDGLRIDAALSLINEQDFSVTATYESDLRQDADRHMAKVEVKLPF